MRNQIISVAILCCCLVGADVVLDDCRVATWGGSHKSNIKLEGNRSSVGWKCGKEGFIMHRTWDEPVNASNCNTLQLDLFVSDPDAYYSMGQNSLELTSSGKYDVEETSIELTSLQVRRGWNKIQIPLHGECDLARINFMRLYALGLKHGSELEIRLANIKLIFVDHNKKLQEKLAPYVLGKGDGSNAIPSAKADGKPAAHKQLSPASYPNPNQKGLVKTLFPTPIRIVAQANVLDFGAKADGIHDDTVAFHKAIEAVKKLGGGAIFVPAGHYNLTQTLTLPEGVGLIGDLQEKTANGTVLKIMHGQGKTDPHAAAFRMSHQSAVQNVAIWYPQQTLENGNAIPFPPAFTQIGCESITLRNITIVNAFDGINLATMNNNSLQHIRDVYATCLNIGYRNDWSLDIGRIENVQFTPQIWLNAGLPGTPEQQKLRQFTIRNSIGFILERVDWTYLADLLVEDAKIGILTRESPAGVCNGHIYNARLINCHTCFKSQQHAWMMLTKCVFMACGDDGAAAIELQPNSTGDMMIAYSILNSKGANAIRNLGSAKLILANTNVNSQGGTTIVDINHPYSRYVNSNAVGKTKNLNLKLIADTEVPRLPEQRLAKRRTKLPDNTNVPFIDLSEQPYNAKPDGTDISEPLKQALNTLRTTGGILYIPPGRYQVSKPIEVWQGIELRGSVPWAQSQRGTILETDLGRDNPNAKALLTVHQKAGLVGITITYPQQDPAAIRQYGYAIRGVGPQIYIVACSLPSCSRGIDFATNRCDEHYVEYLWAMPLEVGINVGGNSQNGLIRDCHITPNCWSNRKNPDHWKLVHAWMMKNCRPFIIGKSNNQLLYHNFTYGGYEGFSICDGAQNLVTLCQGADGCNFAAAFHGNCTAQLVDTQLTNFDSSGSSKQLNYIKTFPSFAGKLEFINLSCWCDSLNAFSLDGSGHLSIYSARIATAGLPLCCLNAGSLAITALINNSKTLDFVAPPAAKRLRLRANVFASGLKFNPAFPQAILDKD